MDNSIASLRKDYDFHMAAAERINRALSILTGGVASPAKVAAKTVPGKKQVSPELREKRAAAQRARWDKVRAEKARENVAPAEVVQAVEEEQAQLVMEAQAQAEPEPAPAPEPVAAPEPKKGQNKKK